MPKSDGRAAEAVIRIDRTSERRAESGLLVSRIFGCRRNGMRLKRHSRMTQTLRSSRHVLTSAIVLYKSVLQRYGGCCLEESVAAHSSCLWIRALARGWQYEGIR